MNRARSAPLSRTHSASSLGTVLSAPSSGHVPCLATLLDGSRLLLSYLDIQSSRDAKAAGSARLQDMKGGCSLPTVLFPPILRLLPSASAYILSHKLYFHHFTAYHGLLFRARSSPAGDARARWTTAIYFRFRSRTRSRRGALQPIWGLVSHRQTLDWHAFSRAARD